jgi:hypothetical protein
LEEVLLVSHQLISMHLFLVLDPLLLCPVRIFLVTGRVIFSLAQRSFS